jgi:hypothetical protein
MTRLMAMTFWGREKFLEGHAGGEADEAHASAYDKGLAPHDAVHPSAGDRPRHEPGEHVGPVHEDVAHHVATHGHAEEHHGHEHGAHVPHESPVSMWAPLVVLAILATIGGFVGVGPAFNFITGTDHPGGRLNIVNWLNPVIWDPATGNFKGAGHTDPSLLAKPLMDRRRLARVRMGLQLPVKLHTEQPQRDSIWRTRWITPCTTTR